MSTNSIKLPALVAALLLAGCAARAATAERAALTQSDVAGMRSALSEFDRQIAALRSTLHTPAFGNSTAQLNGAIAALRQEVSQSAADIDGLIAKKADLYAARQDAAVSALLASANSGNAPSRAQVQQSVQRAYHDEYARLRAGADSDMNAYERALTDQEHRAYAAFVASVTKRAQLAYFNRAQELREKESTLLLDLARADAGQRLQLRAKLQTLALAPAARERIRARLGALQSHDDAVIGRQRGTDAAILEAFRAKVLTQANRDVAAMNAQLQARTAANLAARRDVLAAQRAGAARLPLSGGSPQRRGPSPDLRAQVAGLRSHDAAAFRSEAADAATAYASARDAIAARFVSIRDADAAARQSTLDAIARLQRDRKVLQERIAAAGH